MCMPRLRKDPAINSPSLLRICLSTQHKKACEATPEKHIVLTLLHCGCISLLCLREINEGSVLCQTHLKMFYSTLWFFSWLFAKCDDYFPGPANWIRCILFFSSWLNMSHRSRISQIKLPPTPKGIIMRCAVGASGHKRAHTELALKWTHMSIHTVNTV